MGMAAQQDIEAGSGGLPIHFRRVRDLGAPPFDILRADVGADKDSDKRQRAAIEAFAKQAGFTIVGERNSEQEQAWGIES
jgi:hypothetical protein